MGTDRIGDSRAQAVRKPRRVSAKSSPQILDEASNTAIKRIKNAGISAEVLGWVFLIIAGIFFYSIFDHSILGYFFYFLIGGLYFISTGKYIKYSSGKNLKRTLLANGIVAIPFCTGIIPIVTCVQSFVNYSRFKKLPAKVQEHFNQPKPFKIKTHDIVLGVIFLALCGLTIWKGNNGPISSGTTSGSGQAIFYSASKYKFTIDFPGKPTAHDSSGQVSGNTIPFTTYDSETNNGNQEYDIYAYNWPTKYYNFSALSQANMDSVVSGSLNGIVQGLKGSKVTASNYSKYDGHISDNASFKVSVSGGNVNGYVRVFFINNYEYGILALGSSQGQFNIFANSFHYTGN